MVIEEEDTPSLPRFVPARALPGTPVLDHRLGLLLHWLVPAIDRGMATLCGLVATGGALLAFGQLMPFAEPAEVELMPVWRLRPLPRPSRAARRPRKRS